MAAVNTEVTRLEKETDDDTESIITDERYTYIGSVIDKAVKKSGKKLSTSDKIDKIVTKPYLRYPDLRGSNVVRLLHLRKHTWYHGYRLGK